MVRYSPPYLAILLFLALNSGCELTDLDDREPALYGTVVDEDGNPIPDVQIHIRLHFEPEEAIPVEDEWARTFRLNVPQTDSVQVDILRHGIQEPVLTLLTGVSRAGQYNLSISPYTLTTGLYELHVSRSDTTMMILMPVHASNSYLAQTEAFIRTNNQGHSLSTTHLLGHGKVVTRLPLTDSSPTAIVLPRLSLIAIKDGFTLFETELSLDGE